MTGLAALVASETARWPSALERTLFGSDEPADVAGFFEAHAAAHLGTTVAAAAFYRRSVGAVVGLHLADGTEVVLKAHRPELVDGALDARHDVQAALAPGWHEVPAPRHRPVRYPTCVVTGEELLPLGTVVDAHEPRARRTLARGLVRFASMDDRTDIGRLPVPHALGPSRERWPVAHDLRFDLGAAGGEWIDDLADRARTRLRAAAPSLPITLVHLDWRVQNLRVLNDRIVAVFDWDSICAGPLAFAAGANAMAFTADWEQQAWPPYPSVEEMRTFVREVEDARRRPFSDVEREVADAANLHALAYVARCQHSDDVSGRFPDRGGVGFPELLRERGDRLLT